MVSKQWSGSLRLVILKAPVSPILSQGFSGVSFFTNTVCPSIETERASKTSFPSYLIVLPFHSPLINSLSHDTDIWVPTRRQATCVVFKVISSRHNPNRGKTMVLSFPRDSFVSGKLHLGRNRLYVPVDRLQESRCPFWPTFQLREWEFHSYQTSCVTEWARFSLWNIDFQFCSNFYKLLKRLTSPYEIRHERFELTHLVPNNHWYSRSILQALTLTVSRRNSHTNL